VENSLKLVLPTAEAGEPDSTALQQVIALTRRSDSVAVKSEGTRVLVNAIKSLWSSDASLGDRRKQAMLAVLAPLYAQALAQLVGRSKKYPILVNEGTVALTLMSTHSQGGQYHASELPSKLTNVSQVRLCSTPSLPLCHPRCRLVDSPCPTQPRQQAARCPRLPAPRVRSTPC
jgi:hypothetical protein